MEKIFFLSVLAVLAAAVSATNFEGLEIHEMRVGDSAVIQESGRNYLFALKDIGSTAVMLEIVVDGSSVGTQVIELSKSQIFFAVRISLESIQAIDQAKTARRSFQSIQESIPALRRPVISGLHQFCQAASLIQSQLRGFAA